MIDGVHIKKVTKHEDPRGFFAELMKEGDPGFHPVMQTSYSLSAPGVVKAFHFHNYHESWCVLQGRAHVVIYDNREDSPTYKETQVLELNSEAPMVLSIPPKIPHGYKVIGTEPVGMLYHAEEAYDPSRPDQIGIIAEDDPAIGYDWTAIS